MSGRRYPQKPLLPCLSHSHLPLGFCTVWHNRVQVAEEEEEEKPGPRVIAHPSFAKPLVYSAVGH